MSRFGQPLAQSDYSPLLVLSVREHDEGGGVLSQVFVAGSTANFPRAELLILVHGFNNHQEEAQEAYRWFRRGQESRLAADDKRRLEDLLADSFWPGDANWIGPLDKLDFLVYPVAVGHALTTAQRFAAYLADRTDAHVLHFIGHSLGCRVVLETIRELRGLEGGSRIGKVCLMAAAVPTSMVMHGGELADAMSTPTHLRVLYSADDLVLEFAFPPGQAISGSGEGFFPTAIGRYGDVPLSPGHIEREHIAGAGHGDYWGAHAEETPPNGNASRQSVASLNGFFGIGPAFRNLVARPNVVARPDLPKRQVATPRRVGHP